VEAVLANAGADLAEPTLLKVALRFRGDAAIEERLVERPTLPLTVCEVLIARVSAALRERLVARHRIPEFSRTSSPPMRARPPSSMPSQATAAAPASTSP